MQKNQENIRKRKKKKHPFRTIVSFLFIFASAFLVYSAGEDFVTTMKLKKEIAESQANIEELQQQQTELEEEKKKMEDPDYVTVYARGELLMSKPGEQVFKLPAKNTKDSDED